ncbi:hypothetical protein PIB30_045750 [Stylosanthes scabra]|uniref:Uncharacterized protein n=1 Tax=Stylosanthes scabra TaxID=79078 RepID=A0ABU6RGK4_9FABA|nr:hypothetical protein [Stylosanthes scabra]
MILATNPQRKDGLILGLRSFCRRQAFASKSESLMRPRSVALEYEKPGTYGTVLIYPLDRLVECGFAEPFFARNIINLGSPTTIPSCFQRKGNSGLTLLRRLGRPLIRALVERMGFGALSHLPNKNLNQKLLKQIFDRHDIYDNTIYSDAAAVKITTRKIEDALGLSSNGTTTFFII